MYTNEDFVNEMNCFVKSMIFICKHRKSIFVDQKKTLRIVNIKYIVPEDEADNIDKNVQVTNIFFLLTCKTHCLESSFVISNLQNEILHKGLLGVQNNNRVTYYLTSFVSLPNIQKQISKKEKNFRIVMKSYLKVLLLKIFHLPEDIINTILLYI